MPKLLLKIIPNANQTKIIGPLGNRLKIRVAAPPEGGKANDALIKFLAKQLDIPRTNIKITFGHSSPEKNLRIQGCTQNDIDRLYKTG